MLMLGSLWGISAQVKRALPQGFWPTKALGTPEKITQDSINH